MDGRAVGFGCFCCFRTDLSAIDISSSAAFLGRRPFGDLKNSENDGCSAAVLCGVSTLRRVCGHNCKPRKLSLPRGRLGRFEDTVLPGYQNRKNLSIGNSGYSTLSAIVSLAAAAAVSCIIDCPLH